MKYNFDTLLKEFKPAKEEIKERKDIYDKMLNASIIGCVFIVMITILL